MVSGAGLAVNLGSGFNGCCGFSGLLLDLVRDPSCYARCLAWQVLAVNPRSGSSKGGVR